ncbi:MAG: anthranilate phosphoribosyltransferase [Kiritimatiellia bacterium]|jgi:anthranilate phosphoribosyltransferase|nr:anthranilate phosphoribosyltransferase [Kiritimatiellia bacterium]MDP6630131.1 anthranilate phosphoribosyltransferase [Kiritimatiellia bacterium]MDP6810632.1 anthranilate phosphoribosyltransferase [Kiritimatiellia bacterium]MDP7023717.1 anthranilate phosphoribosyltransferase [Kiritimatiellia bacterium]
MNEETMKQFGATIQRLINKEDLTEEETYSMFKEVLNNEQPDLQQGAFLAALASKGETIEEIVGTWRAIVEFDTVPVHLDSEGPLVENCGTGMDSLKTFNVSTAAAIVASACGATMVRHGARALTSFCGTVDMAEALGVDVECDVYTVLASIKSQGIGLFNGMSPNIHPGGLGRILSQIRFGSTLNIAASLANPARPSHGVRGVYSEDLLEPVGATMSAIGYSRSLVVHGKAEGLDGGMDEFSVCGESLVHEVDADGHTNTYTLRPEELGLKTVPFADIATTGDLKRERTRFLDVLSGRNHESCIAFTCMNAGAALYVAGLTDSIESGVTQSRQAIESGAATEKLRNWVATQNRQPVQGLAKLNAATRAKART